MTKSILRAWNRKRQNDNFNLNSFQICILTSFSGSARLTMEIRASHYLKLNLSHCAHAYGSREHRWVRSTLRILFSIRIVIRTRIPMSDSDSACPTMGIRHSKMIDMQIFRCMHGTEKRQNDNFN